MRQPATLWNSSRTIRGLIWLALLTITPALGACKAEEPTAEPQIRRLTPSEYNNTIRDLFGWPLLEPTVVDSPTAYEDAEAHQKDLAERVWTFPKELGQDGFDGFSEHQVVSPYFVEQVEAAAVYFAPQALEAPFFSTCRDLAVDWADIPEARQPGCQWNSIIRFARRAFRRPLNADETDRLRDFHNGNRVEFGHTDGTVLTLQGLLQSPSFLYLSLPPPQASSSEIESEEEDTPWETAARLSYFLWDSMPDPILFEAASRDALRTQQQVESQARRMLEDPRARDAVFRFHQQWLELDKVFANRAYLTTYGPRYIPELLETILASGEGAELQAAETWSAVLIGWRLGMFHEAKLFIEHTIFDEEPGGGRLANLLTDNSGYVTELEFATGEARPQNDSGAQLTENPSYLWVLNDGTFPMDLKLKPATFPADQRAGVLTLPAVLASRAHPIHPAPVLRGKMVLERIACVPLGQPPDGAVGQAPPDSLGVTDTNRQRTEAVTSAPGCSFCHEQIDPLGFAFENYDSLGGWRDDDNGVPVDASGSALLGSEPAAPFAGPVALTEHLAQSEAVHDCYTRQWLRYALGRSETAQEAPALDELQARFKDGGGDIRDLLVAIAGSVLFRPPTQATAEGAGQ